MKETFQALFGDNPKYAYFDSRFPFRPHAESFDAVNAWWLAEASMLVYSCPDFIQTTLGGDDTQFRFLSLKDKGTQGFVWHDDQVIIVCFRGTQLLEKNVPEPESDPQKDVWQETLDFFESLKNEDIPFFKNHADILANLKFLHSEADGGGNVHQGFQEALDVIWADYTDSQGREVLGLKNYLQKIRSNRQSVWFTGHSLGAALATLASNRYHLQGEEVRGVYTYGSPRVGDNVFASEFNKRFTGKTFRYVNNNDIVCSVPPDFLESLNYQHVNQLKQFRPNPAGPLELFEAFDKDTFGFNFFVDQLHRMESDFKNCFIRGPLVDHAPIFYVINTWNEIPGIPEKKEFHINEPGLAITAYPGSSDSQKLLGN